MTQADTTTEFTDFYAVHFPKIAAQLYAYLGDHAEAQDVTQEAFCRALDRWAKVSTYAHAQSWVRQVAWNLATSRLRHLQAAKRFLARQRVEHVEGPSPDRLAMVQALATLPPKHRLAVVLHHVGRLTTAEIAQQEGVAEGTVRSWLSRGRARLAEHFEESLPDIRPPGVAAAVVSVRRRRIARRATLAAVLALAIAIPISLVLRGKGSEPPIIGPTTPPSVSPSPGPVKRAISVPGVTFAQRPDMLFVDGQHAWLLHERTLASTSDGGVSWRRVALPDIPGDVTLVMHVLDAQRLTLRVTEQMADTPREFRVTTDGGATWTTHPWANPPTATRLTNGRYQLLCPGAHGMEDGANGVSCQRTELVKVGEGRVSPQPPWIGEWLMTGADGRVWMFKQYGGGGRLAMSADGAKTWRELPANPGEPRLSLDGKRMWAHRGDTIWELIGDRWETVANVPGGTDDTSVWPAGDDAWLVTHRSEILLLVGGVSVPMPVKFPAYGVVLQDGTLLITSEDGYHLGYGTGADRTWVYLGL